VWEIPIVMREVLYLDKGRVTIPKDCRDRHGLGDGDTLLFLETKSGALVLKPVKAKPEMDLIDHLLRFKGLELPERTHYCPPRT
jgi:AbrB family looped-hinge helix DNA binding protein